MSDVRFSGGGEWNPFAALGNKLSALGRNKGDQQGQIKDHQVGSTGKISDALRLQQEHHKNVMEHLVKSYELQGGLMTQHAGIQEQAAAGTHGRNLELHKAINKAAESGTQIGISLPEGGQVSYTKKKTQPRAAKPLTETVAPKPEPSPEPGPAAKPEKFAQRDPKTKKITGYAETPQGPLPSKPTAKAPKKRTAAPKKKA